MINRPAFRYHGSKWRLAPWIIEHFPAHECYVEPFGGSAAVLLRKSRSWLEVYNDKSEEVVNFFRVLREQSSDLVKALELTPYAKREWELSLQDDDDPDPVERARRFYIRSYMSLAGPTAQWRTGWRRQKVISKVDNKKKMTPAPLTFMNLEHLYAVADRLRGVQIECDDALEVIARFDSADTLFYIDPPYPSSTRSRWKAHAYDHELTDAEHEHLATILHQVDGMVVVSGYKCDLYEELYSNWRSVARAARTNSAGGSVEYLWLSPQTSANRFPLLQMQDR
jgi:DNA adenine methylase